MSVKLLVTVNQTQVSGLKYSQSFIDNVLGIYLMFNGDCYPNGSYINHLYITPNTSSFGYYYSTLLCVSPNFTWRAEDNPNGQHVYCTNSINNDPLFCDISNTPAMKCLCTYLVYSFGKMLSI